MVIVSDGSVQMEHDLGKQRGKDEGAGEDQEGDDDDSPAEFLEFGDVLAQRRPSSWLTGVPFP